MNVVHVIPSISNESSGPSYSVTNLCRFLLDGGLDITLTDLDDSQILKPSFVKSFCSASFPKRLGRSPNMRRWLYQSVRSGNIDIMHNHSLWMMPNVYSCNAVKGTNVPLVVSPRGTLSEWAMGSGSRVKKIFWPLIQRPALNAVSCFHATAESEYEDIRRMGFKQPVAIIPNGIDIPKLSKTNRGPQRTLLFLGRIHQIKGLDLLLPAWSALQDKFPDWRLRIVGPDNGGYLHKMKNLAGQLGLVRIEFAGPLTGSDKVRAYADSDLFVLPTYSENFGMTVAESLASGTPAVVTKGAPWGGLIENGAGWWINIGKDPLIECLEIAMSQSPSVLDSMGLKGRLWVEQEFSWANVASNMRLLYEWILLHAIKPDFVHSD